MPQKGRCGCDRMVVEFVTTYAISAYHHWCYEFESRSGRGVQHYMVKFLSDLRQVGGLLRVLRFSLPIKLTAMIYLKYCWNKQTSKQICKKRNKLKKSSFSNYYTIPRMNIHPRLIALHMLQVYQKYMQAICQDNKRCVRIQHFTIGQHMHWSFHIFQSFQTNSK